MKKLTPAELPVWAYLLDDLMVRRPIKEVTKHGYGFQECASFINGRWEGFVSIIKNEAHFMKEARDYEKAIENEIVECEKCGFQHLSRVICICQRKVDEVLMRSERESCKNYGTELCKENVSGNCVYCRNLDQDL